MKHLWQSIAIGLLGLILSLSLGNLVSARDNAIEIVGEAREYYERGNFTASLNLLQQANEEFATKNQLLQQAQTQSLISLNQQQLRDWEQAQKTIDYGLALIATVPNTDNKQQVLGQLWNSQGHLYLRKGQSAKALEAWEKAETIYQNINDNLAIRGITLAKVQALVEMGFYRRACNNNLSIFARLGETENFSSGVSPSLNSMSCERLDIDTIDFILDTIENPESFDIEALSSLANNLMLLGKFDLAEKAIAKSQTLFARLQSPASLLENKLNFTAANIAQSQANLAQERDRVTEFEKKQTEAVAFYQKIIKNPNLIYEPDITEANIKLLETYINNREWNLASQIIEQNSFDFFDSGINYKTLKNQLSLARSLTRLKQNKVSIPQSWADIVRLYQQIATQAKNLEDYRLESSALGYLGELTYQQKINLDIDPESQITQALHLAQSNQAPEIAYRWQWQLGRIYRDRGDIEKAILAYQAAFNTLQELRSDLVALEREIQFSFQQQVEPVYRELTELLLVAQSPEKIAEPNNLRQARDVIEALQLAELDNYFKDACLASKRRNIEEIDSEAAVVYTIILNNPQEQTDRLEIILSFPDGSFKHHEVVVEDGELIATVKQLNSYLLQPDRMRNLQQKSQQVYDWLIRPLEPSLKESETIKTLVFVLDGVLQNLPMSALYDGEKYLLEEYAIAVAPGLRLVKAESSKAKFTALAGGVSESIPPFSSLSSVKTELQNLGSTLETETLLNSQFTKDNFEQAISSQPFSIVHLATHGQFSSNPEETFLVLWDRKLTITELSSLLQNRNLDDSQLIDLLVLSACETAKGDRRASLGLAGMSVRTGVSSTVATLWQVSDRSTATMMSRFYQYLAQNPEISKAEALRLAQLDLWQVQAKNWQLPLYWAPYVMVGNWQ